MAEEKYKGITIKNSSAIGPMEAFEMRGTYEKIYPDIVSPFDFNNSGNIFYGRKDDAQDIIHVNEFYLKQINSQYSENLFCINFVADAFEDLRNYLKVQTFAKLTSDNFFTSNWDGVNAWQDPHIFYDNRMADLYQVYVRGNLYLNNNNNLVENVDDFLRIFFNDFYPSTNKRMPLTKSGILASKYYNPTSTGLCIEISSDSHSLDSVKFNKFLKSPNFEYYLLAAAKFGFFVDKNAPWRLVANLNSPAMQKYMLEYQLTLNNVFDTVYVKTYKYDIQNIKVYLKQMYESFLILSPTYTKKVPTYENEKCPPYKQVQNVAVHREKLNSENYDKKYGDLFWLKIYYRIKLDESEVSQSIFLLTKELEKIEQIYNSLDFDQTLDYINDRIKSQTS
jgi:hypothetical protein